MPNLALHPPIIIMPALKYPLWKIDTIIYILPKQISTNIVNFNKDIYYKPSLVQTFFSL